MSISLNQRGQTSFEVMLLVGVIIAIAGVMAGVYFGDVSDQTNAIVILKTGLLQEFSKLDKKYEIISSLEPVLKESDTICFDIKTRPVPSSDDLTKINNALADLKDKIVQRTRYNTVETKLNDSVGC